MIDHIDQSWMRIKGFHYPFAGRDFRDLKGFARTFQEWGVMALWDVFASSDSEWVRKSGYSINAFTKCIPWLVDDKSWKIEAKRYQEEMVLPLLTELQTVVDNIASKLGMTEK